MPAPSPISFPAWTRPVLWLAAAYHIVWGLWVIGMPQSSLSRSGFPEQIPYLQLWQSIGLSAAVMGVGYGIAATNPAQHWAIVLIGLLGKILLPVGFAWNYLRGNLPLSAGWMCLLNDLLWWGPFAAILWYALHASVEQRDKFAEERSLEDVIRNIPCHTGQTLAELSAGQPLMVVFLRHAGCTFCREALSDLAKKRAEIEASGTRLALVHMSTPERAEQFVQPYGLQDVPRFSDPDQILYRAFGLKNGSFQQLLGPKVFWEGFKAALLRRHGFGPMEGNGLRMPGVFLLQDGAIRSAFRHPNAAYRPDYCALAEGSCTT